VNAGSALDVLSGFALFVLFVLEHFRLALWASLRW
jgi:hypothetical protein